MVPQEKEIPQQSPRTVAFSQQQDFEIDLLPDPQHSPKGVG